MINLFLLFTKWIPKVIEFFNKNLQAAKVALKFLSPYQPIIFGVLGFAFFAYSILAVHHFKNPMSINTYQVSLKGTPIVVKSVLDGKVIQVNTQLEYLLLHPGYFVKIKEGELLVKFDSTKVDQDLEALRNKQLQLGGGSVVTTESTTESADTAELIRIQQQIDELRIQENRALMLQGMAEQKLTQAQSLYDQKVVTQAFLDDAQTNYLNISSQLESIRANLSSNEFLYKERSKLSTKRRIVVSSSERTNDPGKVTNWINELNAQISGLLDQKQGSIIKADRNLIILKSNVYSGKSVRKGDTLLEGLDQSGLIGIAKLKDSDIKLIKSNKAKVFYRDSATLDKVELNNFKLSKNELQFQLDQVQSISKTGEIIIERIKE
jgi:multidrug resistance efflux pump